MQFYVDDWEADTCELSLAARGLWHTLLMRMHSKNQSGVLTGTVSELARSTHCFPNEFTKVLAEIEAKQICEVQRQNGSVTVINRRMRREAEAREAQRQRQLRYLQKQRDGTNDGDNDAPDDEGLTPPLTEKKRPIAGARAIAREAEAEADTRSHTTESTATALSTAAAGEGEDESALPAWVLKVAKSPAYAAMDVGFVYWKMVEWCKGKHKQPDRDRLLSWLNSEDRRKTGKGETGEKNQRPAQQLRAYTETDAKDNRSAKKSGIIKPKRGKDL